VLRLLAALGVLTEPQPRSFGLTIVGDRLRSDVPASMRNWAMLADTVGFGAHEPILGAVRTGKTGTEICLRHDGHGAGTRGCPARSPVRRGHVRTDRGVRPQRRRRI